MTKFCSKPYGELCNFSDTVYNCISYINKNICGTIHDDKFFLFSISRGNIKQICLLNETWHPNDRVKIKVGGQTIETITDFRWEFCRETNTSGAECYDLLKYLMKGQLLYYRYIYFQKKVHQRIVIFIHIQ